MKVDIAIKIYKMALEIEKHNAKRDERPIIQENIHEHARKILEWLKENTKTITLLTWKQDTDYRI